MIRNSANMLSLFVDGLFSKERSTITGGLTIRYKF